MTSRERIKMTVAHKEPDRIAMHDSPWTSTIARWHEEGLPADMSPAEYFGFDSWVSIQPDLSPRYPVETVEETDEYVISTTTWGETSRRWKHRASVPEFLDFKVKDRKSWEAAKARMELDEDRVNWAQLEEHYPAWVESGAYITLSVWGVGYDVCGNRVVGTERFLMALVEDPEWCRDVMSHCAHMVVHFAQLIMDRGYEIDAFRIPDDLGYRNGLLFSPATFDATVREGHEILCDFAKRHGITRWLHSCGNIMALMPRLVEIGWNVLNPLEIKAGMDPLRLKEQYGDVLTLEGGIDVRTMTDLDRVEEEVAAKIPVLKQGGGYIYHSDHSVPDNVSFDNYCRLMELVREYGAYE